MIDPFALISGVSLLGASALIAFRVRQLVPAAPAIVLLAVIGALAAVRFGLFDSFTPRQSYAM